MASRSRPRVRLVLAMSLDGRIADAEGRTEFVGREDRRELFRLRAEADAVLVGARTVLADDLGLSLPLALQRRRERLGKTRLPIRVVVSGGLSIRRARKLFRVRGQKVLILTTTKVSERVILTAMKSMTGATIFRFRAPLEFFKILPIFSHHGVRLLQVEGGARLAASILREDLVDEYALTVCPVVLGSGIRAPLPRTMPFRFREAERIGRGLRIWLERAR